MFLNFPRLANASASVLAIAVLGGCSNNTFSDLTVPKLSSQNVPSHADDQYDSYYGSPNARIQDAKYQPKIKRTVIKAGASFKTNAPKRYVVKKGDTLWAISNMFLNNPAYWPEIWDKNQKLANPHRIYPGDVLYIHTGKQIVKRSNGSITDKMVPQMRIERKGLGGSPISTLAPFLAWPHALDKNTIKNSPYIVGADGAKLLFGKGQTVYVKNLSDRHSGGRYAIYHKDKKLIDPDTNADLGYEVIYTGFIEVQNPALNAEVATATIEEAIREIRPGDKLLFEKDETNKLTAQIQRPRKKVRGTIISLFNANIISAETMIITINRGARHAIKPGFTLGVYSPIRTINDPVNMEKRKYKFQPVQSAKVTLPPKRVATAIVYKVLNDISYAVITGSLNTVKKGYKIGNP